MIELGRHSYACDPIFRGNMNKVIVGNFSSIATGVIWDSGFNHNYKMVTTFPLKKIWNELPSNIKMNGDICVGSDCWICENAMIASGVTIGDGCVIGMNTVVTKDLEPFTVKAGHKTWLRFPRHTINSLLKIAWWNWDDERILKNAHLLLSEDIDNFIFNHE
jgi:acetyltransferase-like isoleucine patch superfamily enzyme